MLSPYRRVLSRPGAAAFCLSAFVGRLPISMVGLGIVLQVSEQTGSYSLAGSVSAAHVLAVAVVAVLQGRLIDRFGQRRFLPGAITGFAISLAVMMVAVEGDWPVPLAHVFAALAGACIPPVGSCVRARWAHLLDDPREINTAYSLEAVVDETVFVLGPTAVTLLATTWHPVAGLTAAIVAGMAGTLALASQRATEPPARPPTRVGAVVPAAPWGVLVPLTGVAASLGLLFGSAEVATVAVAEALGNKPLSGLLLALWAFGSLVSGLIAGAVTWRSSLQRRIRVGTLALGLLMGPMVLIDSFAVLAPMLFLAGFAISPTLIAVMALVERVMPRERLTEGMAVLLAGLTAGVAAGAPLAGLVIDHVGPSEAYLVTVSGGLLAAVAALLLPGESSHGSPGTRGSMHRPAVATPDK